MNYVRNVNGINRLVSIVIPCYNQAKWLPDAIESALNQTYKYTEIIVVDDGSTDDTFKVAKKYPVKVLKKKNGGLSSARNSGIKISKGYYILPLDSDDMIKPEMIEKCLEANDDIVSTAQQEFGDSDNLWNNQPTHPKFNDFWTANRINYCSLYKRKVWEDVGGYDEDNNKGYEDWDFWMMATKKGYSVTVIKDPLFLYRKHGDSMITESVKHHNELLEYIRNKNK